MTIDNRVCVRQNVHPDTMDADRHDTTILDAGAPCEINVILAGVLVVQIMVSDDRQYTVFDAEVDGAL